MKPSNRSLYEYFKEYALERGEDTFLFDEDSRYTVGRAFDTAQSLAKQLNDNGITRGDFVAVKADRTVRTVLLFYAIQFIGGVAVMRDAREEIEDKIKIIGDSLYVGERKITLLFDEGVARGRCPTAENISENVARGRCPTAKNISENIALNLCSETESKAVSAVIFTSGSTGEKKAVCLSQYNFINNSLDTLPIGGYREDDINILIVPIHHVFGLALIVTAVVAKHSIFVPRSVETEYIVDCMIKYKVTRLNGVPSLYLALSGSPRAEEITSLRCGLIGGAPCNGEQFSRIERKLKITLVPVYGMSECIGIACGDYRDAFEKRFENVGKIYSMNEIKFQPDGEICIKSPAMASGYLGGGAVADGDGWLHTGDLGYLDEEGYLHISGRKKDIIIRNGNNVSAAKIEAALLGLPYVESAAAVAGYDESAGEVPCVLAVLKAGEKRTEGDVLRDLKQSLTKIEIPSKIRFAKELPLTSTGKTDKERIKKIFA